jgi:hypothetical protein
MSHTPHSTSNIYAVRVAATVLDLDVPRTSLLAGNSNTGAIPPVERSGQHLVSALLARHSLSVQECGVTTPNTDRKHTGAPELGEDQELPRRPLH